MIRKLVLLAAAIVVMPVSSWAQQVYGYSALGIHSTFVITESRTMIDYSMAYYYGVKADGYLFEDTSVIRSGLAVDPTNAYGYMNAPIQTSRVYTIQTNHWLRSQIVVWGGSEYGNQQYDPYGFSLMSAGNSTGNGWYSGSGTPTLTYTVDYYVGTTWVQDNTYPPVISQVSVNGSQVRGNSGTMEIYGSNLSKYAAAPVVSITGGVSANVTYWNWYVEPGHFSASYNIPSNATSGNQTLTVATPFGSSSTGFGVGDPTPYIDSVTPSPLESGGTRTFTVFGSGFGTNPTISVSGSLVQQSSTSPEGGDGQVSGSVTLGACEASPCDDIEVKVVSGGYNGNSFYPGPGQTTHNDSLGKPVSTLPLPPPTLLLTVNGSQISEGQTVSISEVPQMPSLQAQLVRPNNQPVTGSATFQLNISYQSSSKSFPSAPRRGKRSPILDAAHLTFMGGEATVSWTYRAGPQQSSSFHIRGINPSRSTILSAATTSYWFSQKIAIQESNGSQFCESGRNSSGNCTQTSAAGLPIGDSAGGYGVMQLTDPVPTDEQKWNWQWNIQEGLSRLQADINGGYQFWRNQAIQAHNWNADNPANTRANPADRVESNCTFTFSPLSQSPWTAPSTGASYWFGDAIAIKRYNGAQGGDYVAWDNVTNPQDPQWVFHPLGNGKNYVNAVCWR